MAASEDLLLDMLRDLYDAASGGLAEDIAEKQSLLLTQAKRAVSRKKLAYETLQRVMFLALGDFATNEELRSNQLNIVEELLNFKEGELAETVAELRSHRIEWLRLLIPLITDSNVPLRQAALKLLAAFQKHVPDISCSDEATWPAFCKELVPVIGRITAMVIALDGDWKHAWCSVMRLLGTSISASETRKICNSLLTVMSKMSHFTEPAMVMGRLECWRLLSSVFLARPTASHISLIYRFFRKSEETVETMTEQMELLYDVIRERRVEEHAMMGVEKFLEVFFTRREPKPLLLVRSLSMEILARLLGCPDSVVKFSIQPATAEAVVKPTSPLFNDMIRMFVYIFNSQLVEPFIPRMETLMSYCWSVFLGSVVAKDASAERISLLLKAMESIVNSAVGAKSPRLYEACVASLIAPAVDALPDDTLLSRSFYGGSSLMNGTPCLLLTQLVLDHRVNGTDFALVCLPVFEVLVKKGVGSSNNVAYYLRKVMECLENLIPTTSHEAVLQVWALVAKNLACSLKSGGTLKAEDQAEPDLNWLFPVVSFPVKVIVTFDDDRNCVSTSLNELLSSVKAASPDIYPVESNSLCETLCHKLLKFVLQKKILVAKVMCAIVNSTLDKDVTPDRFKNTLALISMVTQVCLGSNLVVARDILNTIKCILATLPKKSLVLSSLGEVLLPLLQLKVEPASKLSSLLELVYLDFVSKASKDYKLSKGFAELSKAHDEMASDETQLYNLANPTPPSRLSTAKATRRITPKTIAPLSCARKQLIMTENAAIEVSPKFAKSPPDEKKTSPSSIMGGCTIVLEKLSDKAITSPTSTTPGLKCTPQPSPTFFSTPTATSAAEKPKPKRILTKRQKEKMRQRNDDIPALYVDLTQESQVDTQMDVETQDPDSTSAPARFRNTPPTPVVTALSPRPFAGITNIPLTNKLSSVDESAKVQKDKTPKRYSIFQSNKQEQLAPVSMKTVMIETKKHVASPEPKVPYETPEKNKRYYHDIISGVELTPTRRHFQAVSSESDNLTPKLSSLNRTGGMTQTQTASPDTAKTTVVRPSQAILVSSKSMLHSFTPTVKNVLQNSVKMKDEKSLVTSQESPTTSVDKTSSSFADNGNTVKSNSPESSSTPTKLQVAERAVNSESLAEGMRTPNSKPKRVKKKNTPSRPLTHPESTTPSTSEKIKSDESLRKASKRSPDDSPDFIDSSQDATLVSPMRSQKSPMARRRLADVEASPSKKFKKDAKQSADVSMQAPSLSSKTLGGSQGNNDVANQDKVSSDVERASSLPSESQVETQLPEKANSLPLDSQLASQKSADDSLAKPSAATRKKGWSNDMLEWADRNRVIGKRTRRSRNWADCPSDSESNMSDASSISVGSVKDRCKRRSVPLLKDDESEESVFQIILGKSENVLATSSNTGIDQKETKPLARKRGRPSNASLLAKNSSDASVSPILSTGVDNQNIDGSIPSVSNGIIQHPTNDFRKKRGRPSNSKPVPEENAVTLKSSADNLDEANSDTQEGAKLSTRRRGRKSGPKVNEAECSDDCAVVEDDKIKKTEQTTALGITETDSSAFSSICKVEHEPGEIQSVAPLSKMHDKVVKSNSTADKPEAGNSITPARNKNLILADVTVDLTGNSSDSEPSPVPANLTRSRKQKLLPKKEHSQSTVVNKKVKSVENNFGKLTEKREKHLVRGKQTQSSATEKMAEIGPSLEQNLSDTVEKISEVEERVEQPEVETAERVQPAGTKTAVKKAAKPRELPPIDEESSSLPSTSDEADGTDKPVELNFMSVLLGSPIIRDVQLEDNDFVYTPEEKLPAVEEKKPTVASNVADSAISSPQATTSNKTTCSEDSETQLSLISNSLKTSLSPVPDVLPTPVTNFLPKKFVKLAAPVVIPETQYPDSCPTEVQSMELAESPDVVMEVEVIAEEPTEEPAVPDVPSPSMVLLKGSSRKKATNPKKNASMPTRSARMIELAMGNSPTAPTSKPVLVTAQDQVGQVGDRVCITDAAGNVVEKAWVKCSYSSDAQPNSPILKRAGKTAEASHRRISFPEQPVTSQLIFSRVATPPLLNRRSLRSLDMFHVEPVPDEPSQDELTPSLLTPDILQIPRPELLNDTDPIFPRLVSSATSIADLAEDLACSPMFETNLLDHLHSRDIQTIGDLARLSERAVSRLHIPVKHGDVASTVRAVLEKYTRKLDSFCNKLGLLSVAAVSGALLMTPKAGDVVKEIHHMKPELFNEINKEEAVKSNTTIDFKDGLTPEIFKALISQVDPKSIADQLFKSGFFSSNENSEFIAKIIEPGHLKSFDDSVILDEVTRRNCLSIQKQAENVCESIKEPEVLAKMTECVVKTADSNLLLAAINQTELQTYVREKNVIPFSEQRDTICRAIMTDCDTRSVIIKQCIVSEVDSKEIFRNVTEAGKLPDVPYVCGQLDQKELLRFAEKELLPIDKQTMNVLEAAATVPDINALVTDHVIKHTDLKGLVSKLKSRNKFVTYDICGLLDQTELTVYVEQNDVLPIEAQMRNLCDILKESPGTKRQTDFTTELIRNIDNRKVVNVLKDLGRTSQVLNEVDDDSIVSCVVERGIFPLDTQIEGVCAAIKDNSKVKERVLDAVMDASEPTAIAEKIFRSQTFIESNVEEKKALLSSICKDMSNDEITKFFLSQFKVNVSIAKL